jgi:NADPH2:quinone reductase
MALEVPDSMDLARAAALPVAYTTAVVALTESTSVAAGETVLIHGAAGGVGLAAVEVAASLGARVLATAGSPEKRTLAKEHGADEVIDYGRPDWHEEVERLTGGAGVDVILDPVGGDVTLQSLRCAAWGGRLLIVGFASGTVPKLPAHRLLLKRISAIGVYWNHDRDKAMLERVSSRVMGLARTNVIRPHIDDRYDFDALPQALEALRARTVQGKAVLAVPQGGDTS